MTQLRQDYQAFTERETEVIAVGPDSKQDFIEFWEKAHIPFIGLADPEKFVAGLYEQEVNLFKFGRVPAEIIVDKQGVVRYAHYASSMSDIPENEEILRELDQINQGTLQP
jgi:peroxiredoxin